MGSKCCRRSTLKKNTKNPYGATEFFAEGWHRVIVGAGLPLTWYLVSELGYIIIIPDLELAIVDIHASKSPKRMEAMLFQHLPLFITKQTAAWADVSATSTTSIIKNAVSTSKLPATTIPPQAKPVVTSTLAKDTSSDGSDAQEINSALGSSFAKCVLMIPMFVAAAFGNRD